jgi:hypothetical protein
MVTSPTHAWPRMEAARKAHLRGASGQRVHKRQPDGHKARIRADPNWLIGRDEARVLSLIELRFRFDGALRELVHPGPRRVTACRPSLA